MITTLVSCIFLILSCSKQVKKSDTIKENQTVARSALPKISYIDNNYTVPIEVCQFIVGNLGKLMPQMKMPENLVIEKSFTINDSLGSPNMYVFNLKRGGYAILSADERYNPLLAVVAKGKYENRKAPGGLIMWLDHTMDNINLAKSRKTEISKSSKTAWRYFVNKTINDDPNAAQRLLPIDNEGCCPDCPHYPECLDDPSLSCNSIICNDEDPCGTLTFIQKGPYLLTQWGQWWGYNDMCPNLGCNPTGYNHNAPTGCVATAMAQVIRYWAVPTPFNFNYSGMPNTYNYFYGNNTEIHRLMRKAADAVQMQWGCGGSKADNDDAADELKNTFGFSSANYTNTYNQSVLLANLNYGYPVILGGYRTRTWFWPFYGYENGHSWVCDGYYRYYNKAYIYC